MNISILERTSKYVTIRIPRGEFERLKGARRGLTEDQALQILRAGMAEHRKGRTQVLGSLRELRYGN